MVELFRAIPLLVLIFFAYYVPLQYGFPFDKMWALIIGLVLYNGSVLAEIFRAGIQAVPFGQSEAGFAIGLRKTSVMRLILLPQAVRAMLPAIVSQLVVLLKDTALGFIINYPELLFVGKQIGGRLTFGLPYVPTLPHHRRDLHRHLWHAVTARLLACNGGWFAARNSAPRPSRPSSR